MNPAVLIALAAVMLIVGYGALLVMASGKGDWILDRHGAPAPADFNGLWAAARVSAQGHAAAAYRWPVLEQALSSAGRAADPAYKFPFYYPPILLVWLKPLGALGYAPAEVAWVLATGTAFLAAVRLGGSRLATLLAAASPAAFACVYVGQNGLLTAALAGAGLALIPRRPLAAGVLIGLIAYKPQFGPALPILLLAGRRWRAAVSATATVLATYALAGLVLGWDVYAHWIEALAPAGRGVPALGGLPPSQLQSLYGMARTLRIPAGAALAAQASAALAATGLTARLWARRAAWPLQASAAAATMLIVSPYCVLYDYPLLAVALAFLLADSRRAPLTRLEAAALTLAFGAPFASAALALPLCPMGAAATLAVALLRGPRRITKVSSKAAHPFTPAPASSPMTGD